MNKQDTKQALLQILDQYEQMDWKELFAEMSQIWYKEMNEALLELLECDALKENGVCYLKKDQPNIPEAYLEAGVHCTECRTLHAVADVLNGVCDFCRASCYGIQIGSLEEYERFLADDIHSYPVENVFFLEKCSK